VVILMDNGSAFEGRCDIVRGEPEKPNTIEEIHDKFMDLALPVWGSTVADSLFEQCMAFDRIADVASWSDGFEL
jgi:hypothetical protein